MNLEDLSWIDRLKLALDVLKDWRVIATLVFFIVIVITGRDLAEVYKKKKPRKVVLNIPVTKPKKVTKKETHPGEETDDGVEEGEEPSREKKRR